MKNLTAAQIDAARNAITEKIQTLTGCTDDNLLALIEDLYQLARADAVSDVIADLKSEGESGAVQIIKANY